MAIPLLALLGSGLAAGANIAKGQAEEKYEKDLEKAQKKEEEQLERQRRREAMARYIGVGDEMSLIDPYRYKVKEPKKPYTSGYDIMGSLGGIVSGLGG